LEETTHQGTSSKKRAIFTSQKDDWDHKKHRIETAQSEGSSSSHIGDEQHDESFRHDGPTTKDDKTITSLNQHVVVANQAQHYYSSDKKKSNSMPLSTMMRRTVVKS